MSASRSSNSYIIDDRIVTSLGQLRASGVQMCVLFLAAALILLSSCSTAPQTVERLPSQVSATAQPPPATASPASTPTVPPQSTLAPAPDSATLTAAHAPPEAQSRFCFLLLLAGGWP